MTANDWLKIAGSAFEAAGILTARLDALVLLEDVTGKDRAYLLANPDFEVDAKLAGILGSMLKRRVGHEPLAYIRGKQEFYGRDFMINEHVMVPRPETEAIIDLLKNKISGAQVIVDVGTGSGALAITAKLEIPASSVLAVDISEDCLRLARENASNLLAEVEFIQSDLLENLGKQAFDVLLCNLPYVPDDYEMDQAATHEPKLALFGGKDGLDLYRRLFDQLDELSSKPELIFTESLPMQHSVLAEIAKQHGYRLEQTSDLIQQFDMETRA